MVSGDSDIQSILGGMSQQQLMQLLGKAVLYVTYNKSRKMNFKLIIKSKYINF